ncbi:unnamed protein product, partial [Prorocentrum cordatum]
PRWVTKTRSTGATRTKSAILTSTAAAPCTPRRPRRWPRRRPRGAGMWPQIPPRRPPRRLSVKSAHRSPRRHHGLSAARPTKAPPARAVVAPRRQRRPRSLRASRPAALQPSSLQRQTPTRPSARGSAP